MCLCRVRSKRGRRVPQDERAAAVPGAARLLHRGLRVHDVHREQRRAGRGGRRFGERLGPPGKALEDGNLNYTPQYLKLDLLQYELPLAYGILGQTMNYPN